MAAYPDLIIYSRWIRIFFTGSAFDSFHICLQTNNKMHKIVYRLNTKSVAIVLYILFLDQRWTMVIFRAAMSSTRIRIKSLFRIPIRSARDLIRNIGLDTQIKVFRNMFKNQCQLSGWVLDPNSTSFWICIRYTDPDARIKKNINHVKLLNNYCQTTKEHYSIWRYSFNWLLLAW